MQLSKEDLDKIQCDGFFLVSHVDLSIGSYFAKFCGFDGIFRELLGKKVFDLVGIKSAEYEYVPEKKCLISKDLNSDKKFYTPYDFYIMRSTTMEQVFRGLDNLEVATNVNSKKAKLSLEIMHFIDLLFSNVDRNINNFGFYIDELGNVELVLLDNECFLNYYVEATRPMYYGDDRTDTNTFMTIPKRKEAELFLNNISDELKELIPKYMELFHPSRVEVMIQGLEMELGHEFPQKRYNMRKYKRNYSMVKRLLKGKKKEFSKSLVMYYDKINLGD